jgi:hypothetical protein
MSRRARTDRVTLYKRICERAGLTPAKMTMGYFTREQMTELSAYLDSVDAGIRRLDARVTELATELNKGATPPCSSNSQEAVVAATR